MFISITEKITHANSEVMDNNMQTQYLGLPCLFYKMLAMLVIYGQC